MQNPTLRKKLLCFPALCVLTLLAAPLCSAQNRSAGKNMQTGQRAATGPRMALLIGNSSYNTNDLGVLPSTLKDVHLMKAVLEEAGFVVTTLTNANQEKMDKAISRFAAQVRERNAQESLFYYSGHGAQVNGKNYLVPLLDRDLNDKSDIKRRTVSADETLERLKDTGCPLKIIILDCCRNDPFKSIRHTKGGSEKGLASMGGYSQGTVIVYATAPGKAATDNVFTPIFVSQIRAKRGRTFAEVMDATVYKVKAETDNRQEPWYVLSGGSNTILYPLSTSPSIPVRSRLLPNSPEYRKSAAYEQALFDCMVHKEGAGNLLRPFAEEGHAEAQWILGMDLLLNLSTQSEAVIWIRKAAEQGYGSAQDTLGWCYETGTGVEKNEFEAVIWYRKAAVDGFADAQYKVGTCYENGQGVEKDIEQAVVWYRRAAARDDNNAKKALARLGRD